LKLGLNQQEFWGAVGTTQSGGSRYESGREMPKSFRELLRLVYIKKIDLRKVNREDLRVAELLRIQQPDLYENLKKATQI
jgi:hypothetical protein